MAVENFSWRSLHERLCRTWGLNSGAACMPSGHAFDRATAPGSWPYLSHVIWKKVFESFVGESFNAPGQSLSEARGLSLCQKFRRWRSKMKTLQKNDEVVVCQMSHHMTKPTKWLCTQRRLRSAWASAQSDQSSLCTQWVAKDPSFLHADSEDSDQIGWMPRLIWVFAGCTATLLFFSWGGSNVFFSEQSDKAVWWASGWWRWRCC